MPTGFNLDGGYYKDLRKGYKLPSNLDELLEQDRHQRVVEANLWPHINQFNRSGVTKLPLEFPSLMQVSARANKINLSPTVKQVESRFPGVLPDYNDGPSTPPTSTDSLNDRVPAESRDSGKSIVKADDEIKNQIYYEDNQQQDVESTTGQPSFNEEEAVDQGLAENQDETTTQAPTTTTNSPPESVKYEENSEDDETTKGDDNEANQQPDEESIKKTSQSIDEEVDRMTQPTSGMVSQQDKPFDYKNTVQFDDSLNLVGSPARSNKRSPVQASSVQPGDLIARFQEPNHKFKDDALKQRDLHDLQVDHIADSLDSALTSSGEEKRKKAQKNRLESGHLKATDVERKESRISGRLNRQKRLAPVEKVRAPYEIDEFLDNLDFNGLTGQATSSKSLTKREPRYFDLISADTRNSTVIDRHYIGADEPPNKVVGDIKGTNNSETNTIQRRGLFDDEIDSNRKLAAQHYYESEPEIEAPNEFYKNNKQLNLPDNSRYHYLTSNDTGVQELLGKKSLFNSLGRDELPPPSVKPAPISRSSSNGSDHQASGSLFSVDHGLLLYPSADEEHHHKEKSMSKKSKKSEKKKAKKKMTAAMKKGGHKKKKTKKEMKKYHKEKKFKGVKKGKKASHGKGGKGGKKGQYFTSWLAR